MSIAGPFHNFTELEPRLRAAFAGPLPGERAHRHFAPRVTEPPSLERPRGKGRLAAGLLLLYPENDGTHIVLTRRSKNLPNHRGQVSLPGGRVEAGEAALGAALREAEEEVRLVPDDVSILGALTPVSIPITGFLLFPFVGTTPRRPRLQPDRREVDRILEVPLTALTASGAFKTETRTINGREYQIPFFDIEGEKVWGATGMILGEFLFLLGHEPRATGA